MTPIRYIHTLLLLLTAYLLTSCAQFHGNCPTCPPHADADLCAQRLLKPIHHNDGCRQSAPFKDYVDFWNTLQAPVPKPEHYKQATKLLFKAVAKQELTRKQTRWADSEAVAIRHAALMAQALSAKPDNSPKSVERCLAAARDLVQFRATFPQLTRTKSIQCAERHLNDPFGIDYAELFKEAKPLRPIPFTKAQAPADNEKDKGKTSRDDASLTFTATIPLPDASSRQDVFLNFMGLPEDSTVLLDNIQQVHLPQNAKSSFRVQLPYASKDRKNATVVLHVKTIQPTFNLLTPWLSSRDLDRRDRER